MKDTKKNPENIPTNLTHSPIVYSAYEERDKLGGAGDAKWISIGQATWDKECFSAKIFRQTDDGSWSRQSEELPLWRVLDLAIFTVSAICGQSVEGLKTETAKGMEDKKEDLRAEIRENPQVYEPRLNALEKLLKECDIYHKKRGKR